MTDIPDEAVQAAAWQLALELGHTTMGMGKAAPNTVRIARAILTAAAPLIAAQATRDVRAERDSILRRIDRLESDESWWVGGAWGDYGEAVIPLRALSTLSGPLADAGPEWEARPGFAATWGDLRATVEKQTAELSALRAGIEALRDAWQKGAHGRFENSRHPGTLGSCADALDALLRGA